MLKNIMSLKFTGREIFKMALTTVVAVTAMIFAVYVFADVVVSPATGGSAISIDTTSASTGSATFTSLGAITITEAGVGEISTGLHTLTLPAGWEFDNLSNVTVGRNGSTELTLDIYNIIPETNKISFTVLTPSTGTTAVLNFNGLKVRPITTTPSTGNITHTAGSIAGVNNGSTSFGLLTSVPGTPTKLAFTTQPTDTIYGSNISTTVVKTQDQFSNDSVSGLGSSQVVTLSLTGTGVLSGTLTPNIGTGMGNGNGSVSFNDLKIDNVGTGNTLTASAAGLTSAVSSTFNITQKTLTATITASNKTYDGDNTASLTGRSPQGVVGMDSVTLSGGTATFNNKNVGTGKTVSATGISLDAVGDYAKYTFNGTSNGTADINALAITVTADPKTKTYGDADPALTYQITSGALISGDTLTGSLTRAAGTDIGTYLISSTLANSNYAITYAGANFTITPKALTVTASTDTKNYDGNQTSTAVPTPTGLVSGDPASFTQTFDTSAVGTGKTLTPAGTAGGNSGLNYTYTFTPNTTGVITAKELTVTGLSVSDRAYDTTTAAIVNGTPALVGVIAGDVPNVSILGTASGSFSSANVGSRTIPVTGLSLTGSAFGNYSLTSPTLTANITALGIVITPNSAQTKVYGDSDPVLTYTNTPALLDSVFTGSLSRGAGENVGTTAITLGTVSAGSNYDVTLNTTPVDFSITAKPITVTASSTQSKTYGGLDPVFAYTVSPALVGSDSFTGTLARTAGETVGSYPINQNNLSAGTNYTITFNGNNFVINKATPVITWSNPADIVYGTALSATQLNASTPVTGSFVYTPASGALLNAGNGQTLSTDFTPTDVANYNSVIGTTATINVAKATPTVTLTVNNSPVIYDGGVKSATVGQSGASTPGNVTNILTGGLGTQTNAGTYAVTADFEPIDSTNYTTITAQPAVGDFVINKADQTAVTVAGPATATFLTTPTLTIGGGSGAGAVSFSVGASTGCSVSGSTLTVISVGGTCNVTATKAADTNYNAASSAATPIALVKATPTATLALVTPSVTYNGAGQSSAVSITTSSVPGAVANTSTGGAGTQTNAGTYAVTADFVPTDTTNYNSLLAQSAGNFVINKATPVITWANPSGIVYGTALSGTQLNASTPVAGSFVYTPASGALLNAGNGQTLSTDFTPTDGANYISVNGTTATINVAKATPTITWATPASIVAGTLLSGTQLNASADALYNSVNTPVAGTFTYSPVSGTQITLAGVSSLSADFTPTDAANYESVNGTTVNLTTVPAPISQVELSSSLSSLDISSSATLTVTGKDQYGNVVTNNSTTPVILSVDNGTLASTRLTLASGVKTTTLSKNASGVATVNAFTVISGALASAETAVTFTDGADRTAPVISTITTDKASYEATNDANITVTVVEDNTANTVTVNGFAAVETGTAGTWTVTFTKSTSIGTRSLTVSAVDSSGNISRETSSYNVVANGVVAVTPTVAIKTGDAAVLPVYTESAANTRFTSGVQFTVTNGSTATVNGVSKTITGGVVTADTNAGAKTLGAHSYDVIVTSSTGHTANILVTYQVNADAVTPVLPTVAIKTGDAAVVSAYTASAANTRFAAGVQFTVVNAASVTVNGVSSPVVSGVVTADTNAGAKTLGAHSYDVIVTSSTGHTANMLVTYQVNADAVTPVLPTVAIKTGDAAVVSAYTASAANTRFAAGVQFTVVNAASVTVNGVSSPVVSGVVTADTNAGAKTLGAHSYDVIVTSSTGHTANILVTYQVNADADATAPAGLAITTADATINSDYYTISGTITADAGNVTVQVLNGTTVVGTVVVSAGQTAWSALVALPQGVATTFTARATDVAGNAALSTANGTAGLQSAVITESATAGADTTAPSVPAITTSAATVNADTYTIAGTVTADAASTQVVRVLVGSTVYGTVIVPKSGTTWSVTVALPQSTATTFTATAADEAGNVSAASAGVIITESATAGQGDGTLAVTGLHTVNSTMTADDSYTNGGSWTFMITVPTSETLLSLKFGDWVSGANSIATANNMRIYSAQSSNAANSGSAITITAANTYSTDLELTGDLDSSVEGRQVQVVVDLKVPVTTAGGSYSTNYGVQSNSI